MFSALDTLVKLKEFVQNSAIIQNKFVRYATCAFSSLMILTAFQKIAVKIYRKYNRLPNGPNGYLLLGCLPQFAFNLKEFLRTLPKHGPVTHYQIAGVNIFTINDYKLARLLLSDERLLTRTNLQETYPEMLPMTGTSNGKDWAEGRKILFSSLIKLTNKSFVEKIMKHTMEEHTFASMDKRANNDDLWLPADDCRYIAFSTVYTAIAGETIAPNDDRFASIDLYLSKWLQSLSVALVVPTCFQPMIAATTISYQNKLVDLFTPIIQKAIENYNENNLVTWLDYTLYEMSARNNVNNQADKNNAHKLNITEQDMARIKGEVLTLLSAGIDTTGYTLEYSILTLAKYPKYQELIYNELIEKFQNKESFNLAKIHECPILRAFVSEILRYGVPALQGGMRLTYLDYPIEITKNNITDEYASYIGQKYIIPKNSTFQFNFGYMTKSEVEEFDINNWLKYDEINKTYKYDSNHPNVFPFSLGKRSCPGEVLALTELHAGVSYFVLNYLFKSVGKEEEMEIKTKCELSQSVFPKLPVKVERRH